MWVVALMIRVGTHSYRCADPERLACRRQRAPTHTVPLAGDFVESRS